MVSDPPKADKNPLIKAAATPLSREGGDEASANDEPLEYGSLLQPARYSKGDRGRSAAAPLALLRETDAHLKCVLAQYEEEDGVLVRCSRLMREGDRLAGAVARDFDRAFTPSHADSNPHHLYSHLRRVLSHPSVVTSLGPS